MREIRSDLERLDFDSATDSQVTELRNKLLGLSRDIAVVCGDATVVVDGELIWSDYPPLAPVTQGQGTPSTAAGTREHLRSLMKNIRAQEAGLRELTLITSQSINDANDRKLQENVLALTGKLGTLTVWLVVLTAVVGFFTLVLIGIGLYQIFDSSSTGTSSPSVTPHASRSATRPSVSPMPSSAAPAKNASSHGQGN